MKATIVAVVAFACMFGVAMANFGGGSYYYPVQQSGGGLFSFLPLLGLLFLLPFLFNTSSDEGDTTIIFGNFSGPTGGK